MQKGHLPVPFWYRQVSFYCQVISRKTRGAASHGYKQNSALYPDLCSLGISFCQLNLRCQRNLFVVIRDRVIHPACQQIRMLYRVVLCHTDTTHTNGCFFLLRHFTRKEAQEDTVFRLQNHILLLLADLGKNQTVLLG